ncbi:hypothetical protein GALL_544200 [mine drainage metagenome]|uniref:Uncharacterized protein n=1 Tax=mine drainage metagenome TaxID=410659 RepID=A0A1J5NZ25_9ZZZZ
MEGPDPIGTLHNPTRSLSTARDLDKVPTILADKVNVDANAAACKSQIQISIMKLVT